MLLGNGCMHVLCDSHVSPHRPRARMQQTEWDRRARAKCKTKVSPFQSIPAVYWTHGGMASLMWLSCLMATAHSKLQILPPFSIYRVGTSVPDTQSSKETNQRFLFVSLSTEQIEGSLALSCPQGKEAGTTLPQSTPSAQEVASS